MPERKKVMGTDLTQGVVWRQLLVFAVPFMLANLLQTIYAMVDSVVVGQYVGTDALAAVTNCGNLMDFYTLIGMGFASAGQVLIGQLVGRRDDKALNHTIGTLFTFMSGLSLLMCIFCLTFLHQQLDWIHLPAESMVSGQAYMTTCACGMLFIYGYNCISGILRGMGDSKRPLIFVAIAACMNLILDLVFVIGLGLGAFGAALATVIGQGFSFVVSIVYLFRKRAAFGFDFKPQSFIPYRWSMMMLFRLGLPMAFQMAAISISMLYINSLVNVYGVAAAAVTGVGAKLEKVLMIVTTSMSTAGSALISQSVGAGKPERIPKTVHCVLLVGVSYSVLCSVIMFLFPQQVFRLFDSSSSVLSLASLYKGAAIVSYMSFGFRAAYNAVINGVGFALLGMVSGLLDGVVARIGFAILLGQILGWGILGFWYGSALAGMVSALIGAIYYYSGKWKSRCLIV